MDLIGLLALVFMGTVLGLMGAGGSILTIPILVYLIGIPVVLATSYSLAVVGFTALFAAFRYRHHVHLKKAISFFVPSLLGVFGVRHFVIPHLPHSFMGISTDKALIALLLMLIGFAGHAMIKSPTPYSDAEQQGMRKNNHVIFIGFCLGVIMGLLGAGGGFLIVPTLIFFLGLKMQEAVPTSLFIITLNSLMGFAADQHHFSRSDWVYLFKFLFCALLGMWIGLCIGKFIKGELLKKVFGYFIWLVGAAILAKEFIL